MSDHSYNISFISSINQRVTCKKCKHSFTEEEVLGGEMSEVKTGPAKGRPMLILICPKCSKKNVLYKAEKSTDEEG